MQLPEISTIVTAVFSGFITALVIESVRYANERKKIRENRDFERRKALQAFISHKIGNDVPPIARLLISAPAKITKIKNISSIGTREIIEAKEIIEPIIQTVNQQGKWARIKALAGIKTDPKLVQQVYRTYYRKIQNDSRAYVWDTRDQIALLGELTTIGRSENNDIVINTTLVSRLHAVIRFENGQFVLYNLTITNPILVNDQNIEYKCVLQDGDVIEFFGGCFIEFQQREVK